VKALRALLLVAVPAAANPSTPGEEAERPRFTINCDHDGWTCFDNFPAISKDHLTIAYAVTRGDGIVVEFVSVATSRVLRRETAFLADTRFPTAERVARLHRELRDFRGMPLESQEGERDTYERGSITLVIDYCESTDCRTTYRVTRRRR
jgi:hypothetical protein